MNINGNEITITEDSLTNALFNGATLEAFGSFTKAEARQAARVMLAGPELLAALKEVYELCGEVLKRQPNAGEYAHNMAVGLRGKVSAAIKRAEGGC